MKLKRLTGRLGRIWHRWPIADVPSFWQRTSFLSSASTWTAWSRLTRKPSALHRQQPRALSRTASGLGFESFQEKTLGQRSWVPVGLWKGQNFPSSSRSLCSAGMLTYTELLFLLTFSTIGSALYSSCYCRVLRHLTSEGCGGHQKKVLDRDAKATPRSVFLPLITDNKSKRKIAWMVVPVLRAKTLTQCPCPWRVLQSAPSLDRQTLMVLSWEAE